MVFILVLIFMYLQISRIPEFRGILSAAEGMVFLFVADLYVSSDQQDLRISRVALRASEWCFILVQF